MSITIPGSGQAIIQVKQTVITAAEALTAANGTLREATSFRTNITPISVNSKILVQMHVTYSCTATTYKGMIRRDGSDISGAIGDTSGSRQEMTFGFGFTGDNNQCDVASMLYLDSPNTTSQVQYQLWYNNDNTKQLYINRSENDANNNVGGRYISTVTLMEVSGG